MNRRQQQFFKINSLRGNTLVQTLIYANLILFSGMVLHGSALGVGMRAILNPPVKLLVLWGAQYWPLVLQNNEWWRCISYAFTHGGLIHIGFNMMVLYQVGPLLEMEIGWRRLFSVYIFTAIMATIAGFFWHPQIVVVGASGSIFGLIGFSISYYHRGGGSLGIQRRNFMFQWAVMAFIFGIVVGADNAAHLGGLLSGALAGWFMPMTIRGRRATEPVFNILAWISIVATVLSIACIPLSWLL